MTNSCHICGLGSYVPPKILTNRDLEKLVDTSDEWIMSRTGIRQRHILDSGVNASDAALVAARAALTDAGVSAGELTHIFVATCSPDYFCPSTACLVAGRLGLSARSEGHGAHVMCMDFNAACSGFLYGLELARSALALRPDAVVLLIGAEALSRRIDFSDRSTCVLFGDGAGAVVLRGAGTGCLWRVRDSVCCADGSMHDLIVMGGGSAMEVKKGDALPDDFFLAMQGREVFRQAVRSMTAESLAMLERHGMQVSDIDLFIAHQANLRIIEAVGSRLGIAEDKVFINVQDYANTSAATLPLALDDARSQGRLKPGMKVLLATFGGGITWGAALLG
ncbi:MAG TPA: ketoacyl-ACP synthase III [Candidatus Mailhella excrementigallinarum]|nr:MAG: 3-oxoacyl-ACP synthase [Desulfovibrionaceae bacterium]HIV66124.1 ketoacyl-ACP synthase III [Candidatus Mailhella excrementigallinarum]